MISKFSEVSGCRLEFASFSQSLDKTYNIFSQSSYEQFSKQNTIFLARYFLAISDYSVNNVTYLKCFFCVCRNETLSPFINDAFESATDNVFNYDDLDDIEDADDLKGVRDEQTLVKSLRKIAKAFESEDW